MESSSDPGAYQALTPKFDNIYTNTSQNGILVSDVIARDILQRLEHNATKRSEWQAPAGAVLSLIAAIVGYPQDGSKLLLLSREIWLTIYICCTIFLVLVGIRAFWKSKSLIPKNAEDALHLLMARPSSNADPQKAK